MSCSKALDFAPPAGAHLSFYWTMDEGGTADKVDSTVGLHWPLLAGTSAAPGLFSNGTEINNRVRGLSLINSPSIVVNQATSKGMSYWYWVKVIGYGAVGVFCETDTSDIAHTNKLSLFLQVNAGSATLDFFHQNDTDIAEIISPAIPWTLGTWHMVAATYDKTNHNLTIYADGVSVGTVADAFVYPDLLTSTWILSSPNSVGTLSDMVFDELGLCLNGALTAAQVTALWNGGAGFTWPNITPIVPYP